jgi:hypothetical protein
VAALGQMGVDVELITTDDAPGRMHQHMVAALGAFGVMALQDAQRAMVKVVCDGALAVASVTQGQLAVPAHGGWGGKMNSKYGARFRTVLGGMPIACSHGAE